jgi:hypothetical protein
MVLIGWIKNKAKKSFSSDMLEKKINPRPGG